MKFSIYNVFIPVGRKILSYNSVNNKFIILESQLYDLFQTSLIENNPLMLQEIHPEYFNDLIHNGFIVDKDKNEYAEVRDIIITAIQQLIFSSLF